MPCHGFTQNRTQAGDGFCPSEYAREWWIDGEETDFHVGIVLPEAHEQVGLDSLSADIAQAGRDDGNLELARLRIGCRAHGTRFFSALFFKKSPVEIFVLATDVVETEIFFHEAMR